MTHNGHFRVEHSCGHIHSECDCESLYKRLTTLPLPCPTCRYKEEEDAAASRVPSGDAEPLDSAE